MVTNDGIGNPGYFQEYINAIDHPMPELRKVFEAEKDCLSSIIKGINGEQVLDIGCGVRPLPGLAKKFTKTDFFGIDNDPNMLMEALRRTSHLPNVNIKYGNMLSLPFRDCHFDFVYSTFNVIGTIEEKQMPALIREMRRIAKCSARITTITWGRDEYTTSFLEKYYQSIRLRVNGIDEEKTITDKGSFRRISPESVMQLYNKNGIERIIVERLGEIWIAISGEVKDGIS